MKNARKCMALFLAAILAVGALSGCGGEKSGDGKTKIMVGNWPTSAGDYMDLMEKRKADFEAINTDVEVVGDNWTFDIQTFYPKAEGGLLPTIFNPPFTEINKLIDGGYNADLTQVLNDKGYEGKLSPKVLEVISRDGKIYAYPGGAYALGMAYNVEMFEKAGLMNEDGTPKQPKDWYELAEFAKKIKEATGKPGFAFPSTNNTGGWLFTPLAWSFGAKFMEQQEDGKWIATFNSDEAVAALEYLKALKWEYGVMPANTLANKDEISKVFATDGVAMMLSSDSVAYEVGRYEMDINKVGMMGLPAGPQRHVTLMGGTINCISEISDEKQIDAAVEWLEFSGLGHELTEEAKVSIEEDIVHAKNEGRVIGIRGAEVYSEDSEVVKYRNSIIDKHTNIDINHVKLYNDFLIDESVEWQAEEPVCAQDLYSVLDKCIQEVFANKDADCRALLEKANRDFQVNYLDNLD